MPQTLKCTECGAVMKTAADVPVGKRVKCPKCGQAFTVAAEAEANPFALGNAPAGAASAPSAGDVSGGGGGEKPAKKGKGMMIGLIAGGALLICCCCPALGTGGWFGWSYFSGPSIQGHWMAGMGTEQVRFSSGGKAWILDLGDPTKLNPAVPNAKYTIDGKTLDITMDDPKSKISWADANRAQFTFELKGEELILTETKKSTKTTFKKVDPEKVKIGK